MIGRVKRLDMVHLFLLSILIFSSAAGHTSLVPSVAAPDADFASGRVGLLPASSLQPGVLEAEGRRVTGTGDSGERQKRLSESGAFCTSNVYLAGVGRVLRHGFATRDSAGGGAGGGSRGGGWAEAEDSTTVTATERMSRSAPAACSRPCASLAMMSCGGKGGVVRAPMWGGTHIGRLHQAGATGRLSGGSSSSSSSSCSFVACASTMGPGREVGAGEANPHLPTTALSSLWRGRGSLRRWTGAASALTMADNAEEGRGGNIDGVVDEMWANQGEGSVSQGDAAAAAAGEEKARPTEKEENMGVAEEKGGGNPSLLAELLIERAYKLNLKGSKNGPRRVQEQLDELYINPKAVLLCMRAAGRLSWEGGPFEAEHRRRQREERERERLEQEGQGDGSIGEEGVESDASQGSGTEDAWVGMGSGKGKDQGEVIVLSAEEEQARRAWRRAVEQVVTSLLRVLADLVDGRRLAAAASRRGADGASPSEPDASVSKVKTGSGTAFRDVCPAEARDIARRLAEDTILGSNGLPSQCLLKMCRITKLEGKNLQVDRTSRVEYVRGLLDGEGVVSASLVRFLEVEKAFSARQLVEKMMATDDWGRAEATMRLLGSKKDKEWMVEECILRDKFKMAVRLCDELGITSKGPGAWLRDQAHLGYKRQSLLRLGQKAMWEGAMQYVEMEEKGAKRLAPLLLRMLVQAGQTELAEQVRGEYDIDEMGNGPEGEWGEGDIDGSLVRQAEERRREKESKQLRLPSGIPVLFVCCEATMREATLTLSAAIDASLSAHDGGDVHGGDITHVLGVDVEWKPVRKMGEREVVQIMQIATASHVIILDIPALLQEAQEPRAGDALPGLLSTLSDALACQGLVKLGFQVRDDMKKVNRDCSVLGGAFGRVSPLLDIMDMHRRVQVPPTRRQASLQKVVEEYLDGAWLNKDACVSDWSRRPLTQSQLDYASLDAWALTQIFSVMSERWDHRSFLGEYVYNKQKKNKGRGITEGAQPPL